jgi:hypothetical protein
MVQAIIYGLGSKAVNIRNLLGQHGDRNFENNENTNFRNNNAGDDALITAVNEISYNSDFEDEEDADFMVTEEDEDYNT